MAPCNKIADLTQNAQFLMIIKAFLFVHFLWKLV